MNPVVDDILMHYGVGKMNGAPGRGSGRYPLGSGDNPYQRSGDFLSRYEDLKNKGFTEKQIADDMQISTTKLRALKNIASTERRNAAAAQARKLRDDGYSLNEIAKIMGYKNDSSIRNLLNEDTQLRRNAARNTADFLRDQIDNAPYGMVDVGDGVEIGLNVSRVKLDEAIEILKLEGYEVWGGGVPQVTNPGRQTNIRVACKPGTPHSAIYDYEKVLEIDDYISHDGGDTFDPKWVYPKSMDSSRLTIRYADDIPSGADRDGVVEIRRGVADLDLGNSHYAQVRILVDDTHYIKGMAMYSDDIPEGYDIRFNTNKTSDKSKIEVLKPITKDKDNPFGSLIKEGINDPDNPASDKRGGQSYYIDENGNKQLSLINKRAEEGDWYEWSDTLPSQFLSKQGLPLVNKQLDLTRKDKEAEFDDILQCGNPTIKRKLLGEFADECDSAAVHLKAAALPRQKYQVILPLTTIADNEVYAPNYKDGETVALIRYPHAGTFEIPILKVNNKLQEGIDKLGTNPHDAIGINSTVAARLSGADFDGDTVQVIPCNNAGSNVFITSTPELRELKGFDPKAEYPEVPGMRYMKDPVTGKDNTQNEMGRISNLITDMTIQGAPTSELARAVRHSMVVIDASKHKLNYKKSEADNDIAELRRKYQKKRNEDGTYRYGGASTLISMASSEYSVAKRQGAPRINKETGEVTYKTADDLYYTTKTGKEKMRTQRSTKMAETDDAFTLSSGTAVEDAYARYANDMKDLARRARVEMMNSGHLVYNPSAAQTYKAEVQSLNKRLEQAKANRPRERRAQMLANSRAKAKIQADEYLTKSEEKKLKQRELAAARVETGAKRNPIDISDREWEAIQAGAIHDTKLMEILKYTDTDKLRERATPRSKTELSPAMISKIKAMAASGYTTSEIAEAIGRSTSTVYKYLS